MAETVIMPSDERYLMRRCDPGSEELEQKQKQKSKIVHILFFKHIFSSLGICTDYSELPSVDLHYDWDAIGVDPNHHTFGSVPIGKLEKASTSMEHEIGTKIETLRCANIKAEQQWPVGRGRPLPYVSCWLASLLWLKL